MLKFYFTINFNSLRLIFPFVIITFSNHYKICREFYISLVFDCNTRIGFAFAHKGKEKSKFTHNKSIRETVNKFTVIIESYDT